MKSSRLLRKNKPLFRFYQLFLQTHTLSIILYFFNLICVIILYNSKTDKNSNTPFTKIHRTLNPSRINHTNTTSLKLFSTKSSRNLVTTLYHHQAKSSIVVQKKYINYRLQSLIQYFQNLNVLNTAKLSTTRSANVACYISEHALYRRNLDTIPPTDQNKLN